MFVSEDSMFLFKLLVVLCRVIACLCISNVALLSVLI